jgi:hypothetical protein
MTINILTTAAALSDRDLLNHLSVLAGKEREAMVDLLAHLAALDARPAVYHAEGYGSLFTYCTRALRLSEDAACNRIEAARASRRFPAILDLLARGAVTLTAVRLIARHLTPENHQAVLERAKGRNRREIEVLVAELAPRPDVPTSVRKLPIPMTPASPSVPTTASAGPEPIPAIAPSVIAVPPTLRPVVQATAPARYRVQFTVGQATHDKLRRLQALLCREIPDGDAGAIVDRALTVLLEQVERAKLGRGAKRRREPRIRPGTDDGIRTPPPASRHVSRAVRRAVSGRDDGQCAFVSPTGVRCMERKFLEFHHVQAYAKGGPPTIENISLRCRAHNQHEAEVVFGARATSQGRGRAALSLPV